MLTLGQYLGHRLLEAGVTDYFEVPGDYNLTLLDELLKVESLNMIGCCNELNAAYAADGYARQRGMGVAVVTYTVGGLSAINGIAGSYAENLPVVLISGAPNTNAAEEGEILHHTLGEKNYYYMLNLFRHVTAHCENIIDPSSAPRQIDFALEVALSRKKPVYIEIACNISNAMVFDPQPRHLYSPPVSDSKALHAAVEMMSKVLNDAVRPTLVAGLCVRSQGCQKAVESLSKKCGFALASMPDAKSFVSESLENYIGIYWGSTSSPGCREIVESSDFYVFIGPQFTDYTTVGHTANIVKNKLICINPDNVSIMGQVFTRVYMKEVLIELEKKIKRNPRSHEAYERIKGEAPVVSEPEEMDARVSVRYLFKHIQRMLKSHHVVIAETGDSWFNGIRLKLPDGAGFEIQMQYGSIGWSVGAILGYQVASRDKRVIGLIGDGSFQMTAQEVSTIIRYGKNPIIFLMNNGSYNIEVQIHDGPYNVINNWNYKMLVDALKGEHEKVWSTRVYSCAELLNAIMESEKRVDDFCLIEVMLEGDDCNKLLLEWGSRVAVANSRRQRSKYFPAV